MSEQVLVPRGQIIGGALYLVASRLTVVAATIIAGLMAQYTRLIEGTTLRLVFISSHKV